MMNIPNILSRASSYLTDQASSVLATTIEKANILLAYFKDTVVNSDAIVTMLSKMLPPDEGSADVFVIDEEDLNSIVEALPDGDRTMNDSTGRILSVKCSSNHDLVAVEDSDCYATFLGNDGYQHMLIRDLGDGTAIVYPNLVKLYKGFTVQDVLPDLATNGTLMGLCEKSLNLIVNDDFSLASLTASMGGAVSEYGSSASDFFFQITDTFTTGGVNAVVALFEDVLQNFSRAREVDGTLEFTNNSHYITSAFSAGIVSGIVNTITGIATAIISVVSPVIGIIAGLVGWIIGGIGKIIDAATSADLYASFKGEASIMAYPMGFMQFTTSTMPTNIQYMIQESGVCRVNIPGGFMLIGYGNAQRTLYKCEFHATPSVLKCSVLSSLNILGNQEYHYHGQTWSMWSMKNPAKLVDAGMLDFMSVYNSDLEDAATYWTKTFPNLNKEDQDHAIEQSLVASTLYMLIALLSGQENKYGDNLVSFYNNVTNIRGFSPICIISKLATMYAQMTQAAPVYVSWDNINTDDYSSIAWQVNAWASLRCNRLSHNQVTEQQFYMLNLYNLSDAECSAVLSQSAGGISIMDNIVAHRTDDGDNYSIYFQFDDLIADAIDEDDGEITVGLILPIFVMKDFGITVPKFNRGNIGLSIAIELIAVCAVVGLTVVAAFKIRSACKKWAARRSADLERAWAQAIRADADGGTDETRAAGMAKYQSLRWKNNLLSTVFGGTKYSKTGFWNSDEDSEVSKKLPGVSDEQVGYELYKTVTGHTYSK